MTQPTEIKRLTSSTKYAAMDNINDLINMLNEGREEEYGQYTVSNDLRTVFGNDEAYPVTYYRAGTDVIAVPDFYVGEEITFIGKSGQTYEWLGERFGATEEE